MCENETHKVTLLDDGTLDTVAEVRDKITNKTREYRYFDTAAYRDETGNLDMVAFCEDAVFPDADAEAWD